MGIINLVELESRELTDDLGVCYTCISKISPEDQTDLSENETWRKIYERNVIINLAFQYGSFLHDKLKNVPLLLSGEVVKEFILDNSMIKQTYEFIKEEEMPERIKVYPDFLIHTSHNSGFDIEGQRLIMEAKSTTRLPYKDFNWDFFKLNLYVKYLNFNRAIYLIVGLDQEKVQKRINNYVENKLFLAEEIEKLFFFIRKDVKSSVSVYKLKENAE